MSHKSKKNTTNNSSAETTAIRQRELQEQFRQKMQQIKQTCFKGWAPRFQTGAFFVPTKPKCLANSL